MIKVTLSVGNRVLNTLEITNDETGEPDNSNYDVVLYRPGMSVSGRVEGHDRSRSIWDLVKAAVNSIPEDRR